MAKLDCHVLGIPQTREGHRHDHAHILLPLTHSLVVRLDGEEHIITSSHLGFIAPGRFHHCMSQEQVIIINIPASMIKAKDLEVLESQVCLALTGAFVPLTDLIKGEVQRNPDSDSVRYLFYYLYDKLVEQNGIKSLRYIRENFGEKITVSQLAKLENYNLSYFTDWFKKQTGFSPSQYIRQIRIEKAKELLTNTHYRLVDVAAQVGYDSGASFTRAFKEAEGMAPLDYRRQRPGTAKKSKARDGAAE